MQNLGEVFKELRKSRNVSLQEATGGEFTYSMLSKFERGEADLSSMKLITALDNIHSDLNEFMYLVRGFSQKKALAFQENLWDLYDREGIDSLHSLYEETTKKYRSSAKKSYLLQMIRIKSLLVFFDSEIRATDEELTFLYDYFFTIDIWGNYELELFSTISTLFPLPLYFKYSREMLQKTDLLGFLPSNKVAIDTILINGLFKAIEEKDKLKADYFVFQIEKRELPESQAYLKIIYMIAKGYYDTIFNVKNKGLEKIQRGITILQDLEYVDGARYYEPKLSLWMSVDRFAEKYYNMTPYCFNANNPLISVDINGDSLFVLTAPKGAAGFGHMAILIQTKEKKWALFSKNGTNNWSGISGENNKGDDRGTSFFNSPKEFLRSSQNPIDPETKQPEYTEGYLIPATAKQDEAAKRGALEELNKDYNVFDSNCAKTVQNALEKAGKKPGELTYKDLKSSPFMNPIEDTINKIMDRKTPNSIYLRIKKQNKGQTIKR